MIQTSQKYKDTPKEDRAYHARVKIEFKDGRKLTLDDDLIMAGGLSIETATSQSDSFEAGSMVIGKLSLQLTNADDTFTPYDFTDAEIAVQIGMDPGDDSAVEWLDKGIFTSERAATSGSVWTITAYDNMIRLDEDYSKSKLSWPATMRQIAQDACTMCGITLSPEPFANENYTFQKRPAEEDLTFRAVLSWAAQATGNYGYCDPQGLLAFGWYDVENLRNYGYDGGRFDRYDDSIYTTGDTLYGGTFLDYSSGDTHSEGDFTQWPQRHQLYDLAELNADLWDIVITGVRVNTTEMITRTVKDEDGNDETTEEERTATHLYGKEGYVLTVENNPLIPCAKVQEVAAMLGGRTVGIRFRPLEVTVCSDPCIEAGDAAAVMDYQGLTYHTILTGVTYTLGGNSRYLCGAVSASEQAAPRPSVLDQKIEQVKKSAEAKIQNQRTELNRMTGLIAKSMGIFQTTVQQDDGSAIFYMHDKPKLEDSKTLWRMSAGVFSVSTNGGKTWNAGMDANGNAVVNVLSAVGITFDWAKGGTLTLGGSGNANGALSLRSGKGAEMIRMDYQGIKLANGASLMSANGVCGNLQFLSNGGIPGFLGSGANLFMMGTAGTLFLYANIPAGYVVEKAILTLKSNAGKWNRQEGSGIVTGHSRAIKLHKGANGAGMAMAGGVPGNACMASVGNWTQITSGGFTTAGATGSTTQTTKTITSENLASNLTTGLNVLRITASESSAGPDAALAYVGTGIAILDVIGYTKN